MHFSGLILKGQKITCSYFLPCGFMLYIVSDAVVRKLIVLVWIKEFSQTVWAEGTLESHWNVIGQSQRWGVDSKQDCSADSWAAKGQVHPAQILQAKWNLPPCTSPRYLGVLNLFKWTHVPYIHTDISWSWLLFSCTPGHCSMSKHIDLLWINNTDCLTLSTWSFSGLIPAKSLVARNRNYNGTFAGVTIHPLLQI